MIYSLRDKLAVAAITLLPLATHADIQATLPEAATEPVASTSISPATPLLTDSVPTLIPGAISIAADSVPTQPTLSADTVSIPPAVTPPAVTPAERVDSPAPSPGKVKHTVPSPSIFGADEAAIKKFHTSIRYSPGDSVATIPPGIRSIPPFAFADHKALRRVIFKKGATLSSIGEYAFLGCSSLRQITLPQSLLSIGEGAFRECSQLAMLSIPERITAIPKQMCYGCTSLRGVYLPDAITDIGAFAFIYCETLEDVDIPENVRHIGNNAFSRCLSLSEVALPDNMEELESYAFSDCTSLLKATMGGSERMLGELIFSGCTSMHTLILTAPLPGTFDCDSSIFDPDSDTHTSCWLWVPSLEAVTRYRSTPGWTHFRRILPSYIPTPQ